MANPVKGEVSFEANEKVYKMRFSANALCELEDQVGMGINAIATQLADPNNLRLKTVRAVFWASLLDYHPDITLRQAGDLVTEINMTEALKLITKAFELTFQDAPKVRPPKPGSVSPANKEAAGTGLLS